MTDFDLLGFYMQLVIFIERKKAFKETSKSLPRNLFLIFLPQVTIQGTFCSIRSASWSSSGLPSFDSFAAHLTVLSILIITRVFTFCV